MTMAMVMAMAQIDPAWAWQPFVPTEAQPWNRRLAAHLYRRAAFGATSDQLDAAIKQAPGDVVRQLIQGPSDNAAQQREFEALAQTISTSGDPKRLSAWWTYRLLSTRDPLRERLTLFWHGHFATSLEKVRDSKLMLDQNRLLRQQALGDFRKLVQEISRDPAMLIYLDSATNRKSHPNENFARELMELFCLGEGHYSEQDVQELARCFTGWEIKQGQFRFNRFQHDGGDKTLLGRSGPFPDGTAADWILEQPAAAEFIAGKLFRQFVWDEPAPTASLLEPLAMDLKEHDWHIEPVVTRLLTSNLFFSQHAVGRKVKSPVDLAIGMLRSLEATADTLRLADELLQNGQGLFLPPNVKGWDGGRAWINASTWLGRANLVGKLLADDKTRFAGGKLADYAARGGRTPEAWVDLLAELLLAVPLAPAARAELIAVANAPEKGSRGLVDILHAFATLAEFQLG